MCLLIALLSWAGCILLAGSSSLSEGTQTRSDMPPPPPGPVPPNASRISATGRSHSVWPPGSLRSTMPPGPPDQTLYSLELEILTSDPASSKLDSLTLAGIVIEAFSSDVLASNLVGKMIQATVKLTGDTRGVRWRISDVRVLP